MELHGGEIMIKQFLSKLFDRILLVVFTLILFAMPAMAQMTTGATRTVTCNGPYGILISLGIENVPTLSVTQVYWFYNLISIGILLLVSAMASERNMRHWNVIIPIVAAMVVYFGWMHSPTPSGTWAIIVGSALLAAAIYMKDSLHEHFGSGGPGTPIMTLAAYLIVFQCIIGIVNSPSMNFFNGNNVGSTPSSYQPGSIDLSQQWNSQANTGGLLADVISAASILLTRGVGAMMALLSIIQAVVLFSATMVQAYPFLASSPYAMLLLGAFQIGEWVLLAKFFYDIFYTKNVFQDF
jgi:hypothetical protein